MTDTSTPIAPSATVSTPGTVNTVPVPSMSDAVNTAVKSAPELAKSPGLAVGVATSGGNTATRAQGVAHAANTLADQTAKQNVSEGIGGDISGALNWLGNSVSRAVSTVAAPVGQVVKGAGEDLGKVLNSQMSLVTHEYRYLHDVEATHGPLAALTEGLAIAAAGVGSAALTGGNVYAGEIGAEAATAALGQVAYKQSWDRTTNGATYTDPHTHQQVSLGRDLTSFISHAIPQLRQGTLAFKITSGLIDGIADMQLGGAETMGLVHDATLGEGLGGVMSDYFPGTGAATAEDFERAYTSLGGGAVRRAMADIAGKSAGDIIATPAYQSLIMIRPTSPTSLGDIANLTGNEFIKALGNAHTADDVAGVFRDALRTHELVGMDKVPTLSLTRVPFQAIRESMEGRNAETGSNAGLAFARKFIRLPNAVTDGVTSMKDFDFDDPMDNGATGLYRTLMYTENRRVAASVVTNYINANHAGKILIYRNALMDSLLAMSKEFGADPGRFNDNDYTKIKEALDHLTGGAEPGSEGWLGVNDDGRNISYAKDTADSDREFAMAITDNQTGKGHFIQLNEMRSMAHNLAGYQNLFNDQRSLAQKIGSGVAVADDFLYQYITEAYFEPLVLLTPSYALHIALAEMIPNALRLGVFNLVKAGIAINVAKLGERAMSEGLDNADKTKELTAISGLVWRLLEKPITKALTENPEDLGNMGNRIQLAARYIEFLGGDRVAPGLAAGHDYSAMLEREFRQTSILRSGVNNTPMVDSDKFTGFGPSEEGYVRAHQSWINADLVKDEKTRLAAATMKRSLAAGRTVDEATEDAAASVSTWLHAKQDTPEGLRYLDRYDRALPTTQSIDGERPLGTDQLDDWSHVTVANLKGAVRGANKGPINDMLLTKIADGEKVSQAELESIPLDERPAIVKGREQVPSSSKNFIRTIANVGFVHGLNPIVNFISREPIAFAEFENQYGKLVPKITGGLMSEDEAMNVAMDKTSNIVIRNVHNLTDRTQWTVTLRNWAPFFFAQEQAYRRMGRLLASDPRAFRQYQLMISASGDIGQTTQGADGNNYLVIPHTGWLTPGFITGASKFFPITGSNPVGMGWDLNSMSVIFPTSNGIRPDLGPVVAIPIQAIADFFPEMTNAVGINAPALNADVTGAEDAAIGTTDASTAIWQQLVPNVVIDRLMEAGVADQGGFILPNRSFSSTMMQTMAAMEYEGTLPKGDTVSPTALQTAADRIRNRTRLMYVMKALIGAITPVSPEIQVSGDNLRQEYDADAAAWDLATTPGAVAKGQTATQALAAQGFSMNDLGFPPALNADIKREGSLIKGITAYIAKNPDADAASVFEARNPGAVPFTVSQSGTPSGEYITASTQAEKYINDNATLFRNYPLAAIYFMPQLTDTKYNATIYNEQLAQGFRAKLSPDQYTQDGALPSFINQLYIAAGNAAFYGPNGPYTKYLASVKGLNSGEAYNLEQQFYNSTLPQFEKNYPIWAAYYAADPKSNTRTQTVSELQDMFRKGDVPNSPMTPYIQAILKGYENHTAIVYQRTNANESTTAENDAWDNYLQSMATAYPQLGTFIDGVFRTVTTSG